jgi:hypothetical protein
MKVRQTKELVEPGGQLLGYRLESDRLSPLTGKLASCDQRRAGAPHRSGSPARPANAGCAAGASIVRLLQPEALSARSCTTTAARRPRTKAKVSCRSASTRSCIGVTAAVDRCEHRRPRCRDRPSKRPRPGRGTTASALPPARAALSQCHHGCSSHVACEVVIAGHRRIVRSAQPAATDRRPRLAAPRFPNGRFGEGRRRFPRGRPISCENRPDQQRGRRRGGWLLAHASESQVRLQVVVDQAASKHLDGSRDRGKGWAPT